MNKIQNNSRARDLFILQQPHLHGFEKYWSLAERKTLLNKLLQGVKKNESKLMDAVATDLGRNNIQTYAAEIHPIYNEIEFTVKSLTSWMRPKKQSLPIALLPSKAKVSHKPKGRVLIVGPFNYPVSLVLLPLVAALAAGNRVIIKPSERTPHCAAALKDLINECFKKEEVSLIEGGLEVMQDLLALPFDHFFFTGSEKVGRIVYEHAAKHLATVTLELGGKSPVVVWPGVCTQKAARKIVWGKFLNSGQTCVAPDYILCHNSLKEKLIDSLKSEIKKQLGTPNPCCSADYSKAIAPEAQKRWEDSLKGVETVYGGKHCPHCHKLQPTLVTDVPQDHPLNEEIFGPILPLYFMSEKEEVYHKLAKHPYPLATYIFSDDKEINRKLKQEWQSGALLNSEVMIHAGINLPFGGVKNSGIGRYRGYAGFCELSNVSTCMEASNIDITQRYAPYRFNLGQTKKLLNWFF